MKNSKSKSGARAGNREWRLLLVLAMALPAAWACGPVFPNWLLNDGCRAAWAAPVADFFREVARLKPVHPPRFRDAPPSATYAAQTADAEWQDLQAALEQLEVPEAERMVILRAHATSRAIVKRHQELLENQAGHTGWGEFVPPPVADGLPAEFAEYFRGSLAFHSGDVDEAEAIWAGLLGRPAAERPYRSTWAAFMLGKLAMDRAPDRAIERFQQVRQLAGAGFADSLGLAAASYGWEARAWLNRKDYARAMELYAEHIAAGDTRSAGISLQTVAALACREGEEALRPLAGDPLARNVITAYFISRFFPQGMPVEERGFDSVRLWLDLLETADISQVELAEPLALAAYKSGHFDLAQRWLDRGDDKAPLGLWLRAKLGLRAGRIEEAAALLAQLTRMLPVETAGASSDDETQSSFATRLWMPEYGSVSRHVLGELGVVRLHRREFTEALDALLRSGYWMDAAYVAERVLTLDELKLYVERHWNELPAGFEANAGPSGFPDRFSTAGQFEGVRYLLARRLVRAGRDDEGTAFFPLSWRELHEQRTLLLNFGRDFSQPKAGRARSLWEAARLTRKFGMELLGTETAPDWALNGGSFEVGVTREAREALAASNDILRASGAELQRAAAHGPGPDKRFHYRHVAAEIAWEAAGLMPNDHDDTARVLCEAGSWLKLRDPEAADRFYKALVRRCGKTGIGQFADKLRWFPLLDEEGRPHDPRPPPQPVPNPVQMPEESFAPFELL